MMDEGINVEIFATDLRAEVGARFIVEYKEIQKLYKVHKDPEVRKMSLSALFCWLVARCGELDFQVYNSATGEDINI